MSGDGPHGMMAWSQEAALVDYAERLERHRQDRVAVHVHLSRLQSYNRREHHLRIATSTFEDLVKPFEGRIFTLRNCDIVFVGKARMAEIDEAVLKLRYLFSEDPLAHQNDDQGDGGFCGWYLLAYDYPRFMEAVRRLLGSADAAEATETGRASARPRQPLTPALLAKLETALGGADLASFMRNQSVCALTAVDPPEPVFEEVFVSTDDLASTLVPDVDITADPWLFQRLTTVLDRRVLREVVHGIGRSRRAFSLNLNISTVLSEDFRQFDNSVPVGVRGRLVIEFQKLDIFHDMGAYAFARDFLRERGYRLCLDGMTHLTLPYIDRERLGLDLVKLLWSAELSGGARPGLLSELEQRIASMGRARVVLCRCDDDQALQVGRGLGVTLFQGHAVDRLLAERRPPPA